ncbi:L,D-transpeptidase [Ancylobacter sp. MQZ15Z-1]|uniref:L,D-transpeptidase n=1 Tax=Ancylobacter mangrovi TaxID=2972472 RepID=A0A9X2T1L9_9HYPH|nr:L,D-transpeptidase [Ancylobacter mangrovi]MCS0494857.1 L,D-transpeptidase [Ancylobacter mangrovi]
MALFAFAAPAAAQSGMYGFESSYRLFSGNGSPRGGSHGWQPGAPSVYPPGQVYRAPPRGHGGPGYGAGTLAVGSAYGSGGGVYGTVPRGNTTSGFVPPGNVPGAANAGGGSSYDARRTAPQMAAATPDYDDDYYDEDGPALPVRREVSGGQGVDPKFNRHVVSYSSADPPGTIIVDTGARFLYLIEPGGKALRYGIGVGREGFAWSGTQRISSKREWPDWRPPAEMVARRPDLPDMMPGGPDNPLGARALYLGNTLYRIHGSNEPGTIGQAVSSGCIRMRNDDVIDLYNRVQVGTLVRVI